MQKVGNYILVASIGLALGSVAPPGLAQAPKPITLANVEAPPALHPDEPYAKVFSARNAARYFDTAALHWIKAKSCVACHTMPPYLMARPALAEVAPAAPEVRQFFEDLAAQRKDPFPAHLPKDGRISTLIAIATSLAFNDRMTTGKLHAQTRQALDRLWTVQRPDGGWDWPFRDVPPIKDREHYGVTFAALGVGLAPEGYARTEVAQKGLAGVRRYLQANPPKYLHEKAMLAWVSLYVDDIQTKEERARTVEEMLAAQRPDGGWALASLLDNSADATRQTDKAKQARSGKGHGQKFLVFAGRDTLHQLPLTSDGYATGFVVFLARQAGVPARDERIGRGVSWLKTHQRASGRWFTPSIGFHTQHLIAHAGSAYAVLALHACGEIRAAKGVE